MSENNFTVLNVRVTFRNVPIYKLGGFAFKDIKAACEAFKKVPGVSECIILQTGSRVEVITVDVPEKGEAPDARRTEGKGLTLNKIKETWISLTDLEQFDIDHFDQTLEVYENSDVYHHLLRLACGLESIVVGNDTILEELKTAVSNAKQANTAGPILTKLFDTTGRAAVRIRDATGAGKDTLTIGDIAVKFAEDKIGLDAKKHVLLIGTGEIAAMVAKRLNAKKLQFDTCSMNVDRASGFSKILGGKPVPFEDVLAGFDKFDVIFVATTADYFILNYEKVRLVMESKKTGTMILDISDPRAVDESVSGLPGVKLMFRDQITEMEERNLQAKKDVVDAVEKMVNKDVAIIEATMKKLEPTQGSKDVLASVDSLRKKELEKALQKLGETDEQKIKIIDELTKAVVENIISIPVTSKKPSEQDKS
ncbi:MAG TPA: glutamyl-tRNA reductase [Candidatus Nitrosotenuis sp.]|nr:glutamyl-tRNA reductase [Candidatus Nitrosotenuis sp.]